MLDHAHRSHDVSSLVAFDVDGALQEAAARATRRGFLRLAGLGAAGVGLSGLLPGVASAAGLPRSDKAILNYALVLEHLQSAFYAEALKAGALHGDSLRFARWVAPHEEAHVHTLQRALGSDAHKKPRFDFRGVTADEAGFTKTAMALEDAGVMAYQGQAGNVRTPAILKAAVSILPVEARHSAWIRDIRGQSPAPEAFNPAAGIEATMVAIKATGFISAEAQAALAKPVAGVPAVTG